MAIFFAQYFEWFLILAIIFFLIRKGKKLFTLASGLFFSAFLARGIFVELIRHFFPVGRPFLKENINLLIKPLKSPSFPSGHAAFYFALAFYIFLENKKAGIFFLIAALFIALSRIFVGVHWPADILAGITVGIFSASLIYFLQKKFYFK